MTQRIIITGGSGFIGHHTINLLQKETDYEIFNYSLYTGYDICNYQQLKEVIQPGDKILHLAAVSKFVAAHLNPARTIGINVGGTLNLIRAAIRKKAERIVHASTGSVYMPVLYTPITEDHPVVGNSIYGHAKRLSEEMFRTYSYDDEGEISFIILRYGHIYGAGKDRGGIFNFIDRLHRGLKPTLYGGQQSNDFIYVKDIARANLLALESDKLNQTYNIGTGTETQISDAYEYIQEIMGTDIEPIMKPERIVDEPRFVYDMTKAKHILDFEAEWRFKNGIKDTLKEMGLYED